MPGRRIGIRLLGEVYTQRIGQRVGNRDDEDAAQHGGHRLRARVQTGQQADRRDNAGRRAEEQACARTAG